MASSSNSSVQKCFKYDVFLSFRGEDTRNNFIGHLYDALQRNCIETYKDDEKIEKGERINDQLLKSIEESRFYIIVFSKNYASSSWCLDELVKIMECQKMTGHMAFPIFYDVEPTQVRKQDGPVGEAFSKPSEQEASGKWRDAMEELAGLAGWDLKATANGDESKLIQLLVDVIFNKKFSTLSNADGKLVGMETRISDVLSSLEIGTEDVRMIGIKGIGGGGKTTLARAVYDQISNHFDGKSFVDNVREVSEPTLSGLKKLQKRILKDVLNKQDITFGSVHDGKSMLKAALSCRKILVVLDDVDRIEQLEALAGEHDWFKSGSRIIITTRDEQVLKSANFVQDVNLLSHEEAICLFSNHAFPKEIPLQEYEELSEQVVQYANGLPLTIEVLGKLLCGKDKGIWEDVIRRLKEIPLKDTLDKLELSYDSLEDEHKQIFLDIVCMLKGKSREYAIRVLECCGYHAIHGLKVLEQRSLITISPKYGVFGELVLGMHDHIEEMGKNIVRREHPDEPNKHSRLWIKEEIEDILDNDMGTKATRCLKMARGNPRIDMKGLEKMKKLQYLEVDLEFYKFKMKKLQFFKKFTCQQVVKSSPITHSKLRTFDLGLTPNLETLFLFHCADFVELHVSAPCPNLKSLNLSHSRLRSLDLELIPNLEELYLQYSKELVEINASVECLTKVVELNLSGCALLEKLPEDLGRF
ncbi:Toll/interleukin-1 receptor domain-containing protein [Tanacetum coccineum]